MLDAPGFKVTYTNNECAAGYAGTPKAVRASAGPYTVSGCTPFKCTARIREDAPGFKVTYTNNECAAGYVRVRRAVRGERKLHAVQVHAPDDAEVTGTVCGERARATSRARIRQRAAVASAKMCRGSVEVPAGKKLANGKSASTPCGTTCLNDCFVAAAPAKTCDPPTGKQFAASFTKKTDVCDAPSGPACSACFEDKTCGTYVAELCASSGCSGGLPYDKKYMEWVEVKYKNKGSWKSRWVNKDARTGNGKTTSGVTAGAAASADGKTPTGGAPIASTPCGPNCANSKASNPLEWMPRISRVP